MAFVIPVPLMIRCRLFAYFPNHTEKLASPLLMKPSMVFYIPKVRLILCLLNNS